MLPRTLTKGLICRGNMNWFAENHLSFNGCFPNMGLSPPRAKPQSDWFQDVSSLWHIHSFETILLDMICCYWWFSIQFPHVSSLWNGGWIWWISLPSGHDIQWTNGPTTPQNPWDNRNKRQDTAWHKFLHQTFERSSFDLPSQDQPRFIQILRGRSRLLISYN